MEQVLSESNLVISIDAMGGDNSPKVVIEGLALAHKRIRISAFWCMGTSRK